MTYSANWDESQPDGDAVDAADVDLWDRNIQRNTRERIEAFLGITDFVAQTTTADNTLKGKKLDVRGVAASSLLPGSTSFAIRNNADSANNLLVTDAGDVTIRNNLSVLGALSVTGGITTAASLTPTCYVTRATSASISAGTALTFTAEVIDSAALFTLGSPTRITAPTTGTYLYIFSGLVYNNIGINSGTLVVKKNGATVLTQHSHEADISPRTPMCNVGLVSLAATDYIEFLLAQTSGNIIDTHVVVIKLL